jgi:large subunit ribosomal protein L24
LIKSSKPRIQRLFRMTAPLHIARRFLNAHIDKKLKEKLGIKRRTVTVVQGDSVKVVSGSHKGQEGKVVLLNVKKGRVAIDSISSKTMRGKESHPMIGVGNLSITELNLADKWRAEKLKVKQHAPSKQAIAAKGEGAALPPKAVGAGSATAMEDK